MSKPRQRVALIRLCCEAGALWTWEFTNWDGCGGYGLQSKTPNTDCAYTIRHATNVAKRCGFFDARVCDVVLKGSPHAARP